ncbi:Osteocrin [Varanus komodoensis]|nr:Osteocrin [Varanus komodoensis]
MPACAQAAGRLVLAVALLQLRPAEALWVQALQEPALPLQQPLGPSLARDAAPPPRSSEEKAAVDLDLAAKLLLLDELVSLENDVFETKKKRSFSGFGSPLDRLSAGSLDLKSRQRKVTQLPKRRFGLPLDRIGTNRLSDARG